MYEHFFYLSIIFILLIKFFRKNKMIIKNIPTIEYYEWKKLYYKTLVLHEIKKMNTPKWSKNRSNKSAYF
jgi:hypothetical protein